MAHVIGITNQKGGVGKTTTAVNLAACLAAAGKSTLLIDLDPQGNATSGLGIDPSEPENTVYEILAEGADAGAAIQETFVKNLALIPSNIDLSAAELALMDQEDRVTQLRAAISSLREQFDLILIDSPPSLSLLTLNVLAAADSALAPVQCEYYALEGLSTLMRTLERVRGSVNPDLRMLGILMTMFDRRTNLAQEVVDEVRRAMGESVFDAVIPRSVKLSEAPSHGKPIIFYDFNSPGSAAYIQLCKEVLDRVEESRTGAGAGRPVENRIRDENAVGE